MKHLKSSSRDLQELFSRNISVRYIAEPLASFDADASAQAVQLFMTQRDYDVIGVRRQGTVAGYARASELSVGILGDHLIELSPSDLINGQE